MPRRTAARTTFHRVASSAWSTWFALQAFDLRVERRDGRRRHRYLLGRRGLRKKLERVRIDVRRLGQQNRTLHHVGELAHVARPSVRTQRGPRARRQTLGGKSVVLTGESEKVLGEHRNVVATLAKRWQAQRHDGETVVEVLAESTGANRRHKIFVRRGDDRDVHGLAARAAEAAHSAFLDDVEQLRLKGVG
jgi:hypothetical protein